MEEGSLSYRVSVLDFVRFFRNQLKINNIKIKQAPFHSGYVISDSGHAEISCR
jgi:hypothetical protein